MSPRLLSQGSLFTLHKIIWDSFPKWKCVTLFLCLKSADSSPQSTEKSPNSLARNARFQHPFGHNPTSVILGHCHWYPLCHDHFTLPVSFWLWPTLSCLCIFVQAVPSARYTYLNYLFLVNYFSIKIQLGNSLLYKFPSEIELDAPNCIIALTSLALLSFN